MAQLLHLSVVSRVVSRYFIISLWPVSQCHYRPPSPHCWGPGGPHPGTPFFLLAANIKHHDVNWTLMISYPALLSRYVPCDRAALFSGHLGIKENINEDIKTILMISIQMSPWSTLVSRPVWAPGYTAPWPPGCTRSWASAWGCCSTPVSPPVCTPPWAPAWPPPHTPDKAETQLRCH